MFGKEASGEAKAHAGDTQAWHAFRVADDNGMHVITLWYEQELGKGWAQSKCGTVAAFVYLEHITL